MGYRTRYRGAQEDGKYNVRQAWGPAWGNRTNKLSTRTRRKWKVYRASSHYHRVCLATERFKSRGTYTPRQASNAV